MAAPDPRARILVVDDDEGLLVLMAESLREAGHDVAIAGSGREALRWLASQTPDLMLLDLKLRDIDGPDLLAKVPGPAAARIPFLVVTGQGDERAAVEVMKRGALDYVMKDTALLDLLPTIVQRTLAALQRERELVAAQAETRRLEQEVLAASERERHTIGADLHDGLGQLLTAVEFMCAALKADTACQADVNERLDQMGTMLRDAVAQTRFLARGLVPLGGGPDALQTGLAELASRTTSLRKAHCEFECPELVVVRDEATAMHLYRIAQEAVNNAVKHSGADRIGIRLRVTGGRVELQVSDNGSGLAGESQRRSGVGLGVMQHRAKMIGAELRVDSRPRAGVSVNCSLPYPV